jgi:hypothetical protein
MKPLISIGDLMSFGFKAVKETWKPTLKYTIWFVILPLAYYLVLMLAAFGLGFGGHAANPVFWFVYVVGMIVMVLGLIWAVISVFKYMLAYAHGENMKNWKPKKSAMRSASAGLYGSITRDGGCVHTSSSPSLASTAHPSSSRAMPRTHGPGVAAATLARITAMSIRSLTGHVLRAEKLGLPSLRCCGRPTATVVVLAVESQMTALAERAEVRWVVVALVVIDVRDREHDDDRAAGLAHAHAVVLVASPRPPQRRVALDQHAVGGVAAPVDLALVAALAALPRALAAVARASEDRSADLRPVGRVSLGTEGHHAPPLGTG